MNIRILASALVALAVSPLCVSPARAAESYDNCKGTISSLPATVGTQGVWCLKGDLATNISSGYAITITAPNVTIDCNHFKLGGLAGGAASTAVGIYWGSNTNITVRNCTIRGFAWGVGSDLADHGGHVVEDNRFDGQNQFGILMVGDGSVVRRNVVLDIGPSNTPNNVVGIVGYGNVDIVDNQISSLVGNQSNPWYVLGIFTVNATSGVIQNNRISNMVKPPGGTEAGIFIQSTNQIIRGNSIHTTDATNSLGVQCVSNTNLIMDNATTGPGAYDPNCYNAGGNVAVP